MRSQLLDDGSITICDSSTTTIDLFSLISGEQSGGVWSQTSGTGGVFDPIAGTFTPALGVNSSTFNYTLTATSPCIDDFSVATSRGPGAPTMGAFVTWLHEDGTSESRTIQDTPPVGPCLRCPGRASSASATIPGINNTPTKQGNTYCDAEVVTEADDALPGDLEPGTHRRCVLDRPALRRAILVEPGDERTRQLAPHGPLEVATLKSSIQGEVAVKV